MLLYPWHTWVLRATGGKSHGVKYRLYVLHALQADWLVCLYCHYRLWGKVFEKASAVKGSFDAASLTNFLWAATTAGTCMAIAH